MEQTNLDFDFTSGAGVSDEEPSPLLVADNEQRIVEQTENVDDGESGTIDGEENQIRMKSL